jgi:pimeloyl-ACP methyl ester carboxylesterase
VSAPTVLRHNRADLALHQLRPALGSGPDAGAVVPPRPLLLLHGLGEAAPERAPRLTDGWPGPVFGLDFTGHGRSTVPRGGGYTAEILLGDVDAALAHLGQATVLGRGLGAYIALLVAGARPELVRGAVLADGPGLVGGGIRPGSPYVMAPPRPPTPTTPDPLALLELSRDVRPPDYVAEYVRQVMEGSGLDQPVVVAAVTRPEWLAAVVAEPGVLEAPVTEALARFAAVS